MGVLLVLKTSLSYRTSWVCKQTPLGLFGNLSDTLSDFCENLSDTLSDVFENLSGTLSGTLSAFIAILSDFWRGLESCLMARR